MTNQKVWLKAGSRMHEIDHSGSKTFDDIDMCILSRRTKVQLLKTFECFVHVRHCGVDYWTFKDDMETE
jgi:hypothetical protein